MRKILQNIKAIPAQIMWWMGCVLFMCMAIIFMDINDHQGEDEIL
jgi:hypothetical protein